MNILTAYNTKRRTNHIYYLFSFLVLLFPYIGFIPNIDIQPFFVIIGIFLFVVLYKVDVLSFNLLCLALLLGLLRITFEVLYKGDFSLDKQIVIYLVGILTIFILYNVTRIYINEKMFRCIMFSFYIYIFVGCIQLFYPGFLEFLVTRDNSAALAKSGRGVKSLTGEASSFGRIIMLFNLIFIAHELLNDQATKVVLKKVIVKSLLFLSCTLLLSQSFYAFTLHAIVIFFLILAYSFRLSLFCLCVFSLFVFILVSYFSIDSRFFLMLTSLINNPEFLFSQGAIRRVLNIPISINASNSLGFLGTGFDSYNLIKGTLTVFGFPVNYDIQGRNLGGFIEYYLKFGLLAIPLFFIYFFAFISLFRLRSIFPFARNRLIFLFLFSMWLITFIDGSMVNPLTWFTFFYMFFKIKEQYSNRFI